MAMTHRCRKLLFTTMSALLFISRILTFIVVCRINELTPITIASSHLISLKEDNILKLEDQLEKLQSANEELYKELQEYEKQASQLRSDIVQDITRLKQVDNVPTDVQLEEQIRSLVLLLKD